LGSISTIHKIFQKYQEIEQALIFGSRAKGNYKEGSDIDLTLIGKNLTTNDLLNIASDLEDSNLPYLFDLSQVEQLSAVRESLVAIV
jgi:predicted nucleotidyltransferase